MDISHFIGKLLYTNDCVIIPGFGGFVAHYGPARIHPINHSFYPPSKHLLFNSKLVRDDGLLIDYISDQQALTYGEAKLEVEKFARDARARLADGGVIRVKNVGNLQQDSEGKILFNPDETVNYLEDAFGLPTLVSPPIIRKKAHAVSETKFIDRKPESMLEKKRKRALVAYLALIPVLLIAGWYIFFGMPRPDNTQQSGMLDLSDTEFVAERNTASIENSTTLPNPPLESLDFSDGIQETHESSEPEVLPEPILSPPVKKYYVIGGAFGIETNADKLVAVLRKKGFDAHRAGLSRSGLHIVSYFSSEDKTEALVNLDIVRREDNPSAWLLRK